MKIASPIYLQDVKFEDLVLAYRKAKTDTFYESSHLMVIDFLVYERNLYSNLQNLLDRIHKYDLKYFRSEEFCGEHFIAFKSLSIKDEIANSANYTSSIDESWKFLEDYKKGSVELKYRVLGRHSVDFHVLSSLWIEKVGSKLENKLTQNSYGCRLRRSIEGKGLSDYHNSHFVPYFNSYKAWQNNGLNAIKESLNRNEKVIVLTADIEKFYHNVELDFLKNDAFFSFLNVQLTSYDEALTNLLCSAITSWSKRAAQDELIDKTFKSHDNVGLPIGLGASKIIANLLLAEFDKQIIEEVNPIYYGRYVDDIFIVLKDHGRIKSIGDFWSFLAKDLGCEVGSREIKLKVSYSISNINFNEAKQKLFLLEGTSGLSFIEAVSNELNENSSEWNLPPNSNLDLTSFRRSTVSATRSYSEGANSFRKAEGISLKRLRFVLYLKRFESSVKLLPRTLWEKDIEDYFNIFHDHYLKPENLDSSWKYIPRVIGLAVYSGNFDFVKRLISTLDSIKHKLYGSVKKNEVDGVFEYLKRITQDWVLKYARNQADAKQLVEIKWFDDLNRVFIPEKSITTELVSMDLHYTSLKELLLTRRLGVNPDIEYVNKDINGLSIDSDDNVYLDAFMLVENNAPILPSGFRFSTRPLKLAEITFFIDYSNNVRLDEALKKFKEAMFLDLDNSEVVILPHENGEILKIKEKLGPKEDDDKRVFALANLETKDESWTSDVLNHYFDVDGTRHQRILDLVNDILRCKKRIDYVCFPELSIPRSLLFYCAQRFLYKGISLIAGVSYLKLDYPEIGISGYPCRVRNEAFLFLTTNGLYNRNHFCKVHAKDIPAYREKMDLEHYANAKFPYDLKRDLTIYSHGDFYFGLLICNEYLDIERRSFYRGKIDSLIVLEWNKDTHTYNALVESSANDIHSSIVQVNNRKYGDTRVRVPRKNDWERDLVRVMGGELDNFVVVKVPVEELRQFQYFNSSPEKPFKPIPTGFKMADFRYPKGVRKT